MILRMTIYDDPIMKVFNRGVLNRTTRRIDMAKRSRRQVYMNTDNEKKYDSSTIV